MRMKNMEIKNNQEFESLKNSYWRLSEELGHEPSSKEVDACSYMYGSRYLQLHYGGLVAFRKLVGSLVPNQTTGELRTEKFRGLQERTKKYEKEMFMKLFRKYNTGGVMVMREYCYQQYADENKDWCKNMFSDVAIIKDNHVDLFDFFYPQDMASFDGCIRIKLEKLISSPVAFRPEVTYTVTFVCINPEITQEMVSRSTLIDKGVDILSHDEFHKRYL